jgi:hypothetical protein
MMGEPADREHAIVAMGEWGDAEAFEFLANEVQDRHLPLRLRRVLLTALARINGTTAMPYLVEALSHPDISIRETAAGLLGQIGEAAMAPVLLALQHPQQEEGALLALQQLPMPPSNPIEDYACAAVSRAVEYDCLRRAVELEGQSESMSLLAGSLGKKSNEYGIRALHAIGLLGDREAMTLVIEILQTHDLTHRANVIEALESIHARWREIVQPLTRLWEEEAAPAGAVDWQRLMADEDEWIRDCTSFAAYKLGEMKMENIPTLSLMERILFFKQVLLFAGLAPGDLKQVAAVAQEESFSDGATIVRQGDVGDMMFIVVSGEISVTATNGKKRSSLPAANRVSM